MVRNMTAWNFYPRIIHGPSEKAHAMFDPLSIDLLFIDGWHTYDAVYRDIENFYVKMKPKSIMAGHDYYNYEDVRKAVGQFFEVEETQLYWDTHQSSIWKAYIDW